MATYSTLNPGATGSDVTKLKEYLAKNGLTVKYNDANYGNTTLGLVKQFQKAQGLADNGIVDANTWSKLTAVDDPVYATTPRGTQYDTKTTTPTKADLAALEGSKPAAYVSPYQDQIASLLNQITNRADFSYDFASDPMYQQQQQRYQQAGKMAMQDTMGNAAALTGGYGNSYGVTAGQQAYNSYLQGANDIIPELRSAALDQYTQQGTGMYNQLSAIQGLEDPSYNKYANANDDYYAQLAYYQQKAAEEQAQSNWQAEYDLANPAKSGGGGGGGGSSSKRSSGGGSGTGGAAAKPGAAAATDGAMSTSAATSALKTIRATEGQTAAYRAISEMLADGDITAETAKALRNSKTIFGSGVTI